MTIQMANKPIGPIGYGLMSLNLPPNKPTEDQAFACLRAALASGQTYWNAGEFYGSPTDNSLTLLRAYFTKYPADAEKVVLNVKGAFAGHEPQGSREGIRTSVENCVRLLGGTKKIDHFEMARVDPRVPIEESMGYLRECVDERLIGGIAMSEPGVETLRRAAKVAKIEAVEIELSLFHAEILGDGFAEACAELGIPILAYSPLGKGFLTGSLRKYSDMPENDMRRMAPRFSPENFDKNLALVDEVQKLAIKKGCTSGQLAIGWLLGLSKSAKLPAIIPIPGSSNPGRVEQNGVVVDLTEEEVAELNEVVKRCEVRGDRYPAKFMSQVGR